MFLFLPTLTDIPAPVKEERTWHWVCENPDCGMHAPD